MPQQLLTLIRDPLFGIEIDSNLTIYADNMIRILLSIIFFYYYVFKRSIKE